MSYGPGRLDDQEAQRRLAVMSQPTRFKIMCTLSQQPMGVLRLSEYVGRSAGTVSYHVQALQDAGLVARHKFGLCIDGWAMRQVATYLEGMIVDAAPGLEQ